MDRKEFLISSGKIAALAAFSVCFHNCANNSDSVTAPTGVDFTIDLGSSEGAPLKTIGGAVYKQGIVVARISDTGYTALSQACTHQGTTVQFISGRNEFHCPNHGSNFDVNGNVINGPASRNLAKYNVTLTGNTLRVNS